MRAVGHVYVQRPTMRQCCKLKHSTDCTEPAGETQACYVDDFNRSTGVRAHPQPGLASTDKKKPHLRPFSVAGNKPIVVILVAGIKALAAILVAGNKALAAIFCSRQQGFGGHFL